MSSAQQGKILGGGGNPGNKIPPVQMNAKVLMGILGKAVWNQPKAQIPGDLVLTGSRKFLAIFNEQA